VFYSILKLPLTRPLPNELGSCGETKNEISLLKKS